MRCLARSAILASGANCEVAALADRQFLASRRNACLSICLVHNSSIAGCCRLACCLVLPWLLGAAPAADNGPCDPAAACFDAAISLPSAVGDFYVDGALVAAGVNSARITTTPDVPHTIEVRNMQDPAVPGYGSLFIYQDQTATQQTIAGRIWRIIFYPRQFAIRGTLRYFCRPVGVPAG